MSLVIVPQPDEERAMSAALVDFACYTRSLSARAGRVSAGSFGASPPQV